MKDYKLSEIKKICEEHYVYDKWCEGCLFNKGQECEITGQDFQPWQWQIDLYKTAEQYRAEMIEQCGGCPAFSGDDCTRNPYTEGCLKEENEDETKWQLIADLNKVAVRMNWGTIERTINDDGTNGMPYMIDVIARTIAYLKGESDD